MSARNQEQAYGWSAATAGQNGRGPNSINPSVGADTTTLNTHTANKGHMS